MKNGLKVVAIGTAVITSTLAVGKIVNDKISNRRPKKFKQAVDFYKDAFAMTFDNYTNAIECSSDTKEADRNKVYALKELNRLKSKLDKVYARYSFKDMSEVQDEMYLDAVYLYNGFIEDIMKHK